jgi:beta-phosphoglucomutase-like phosphatase (HAD superfamily)
MTTSAIIFDMDGTMIDSMPFHAQSWQVFCDAHGLSIDLPDVMRRTTGRTGTECMADLFQRSFTPDEARALVHHKEQIYRDLFAPVFREVHGFKHFASAARARGLHLGVGTAGDQANVQFALGHLAMDPHPAAIVRGDEGLRGKPSPDIFLEAARRLQVAPAHCIVFEDAPLGIEAARRAGMRAVAVCSGHSPAELAGPHVLAAISSYHELIDNRFLENLHVA